jgi:Holliday junction resolvase RusA-like endonuclease
MDSATSTGLDKQQLTNGKSKSLNSSRSIRFLVPAIPIAQPRQRHRVVSAGGRYFASNYTPAKDPVNAFKAAVQLAANRVYAGPPLVGPLRMDLVFVFPRPKSVPKKLGSGRQWHTVKPDRDNLQKSVQDALNGLLYRDDSQICDGVVLKFRAAEGEQPHVEVTVEMCIDPMPCDK